MAVCSSGGTNSSSTLRSGMVGSGANAGMALMVKVPLEVVQAYLSLVPCTNHDSVNMRVDIAVEAAVARSR